MTATDKVLGLPAPDDFLWQYVTSTPLGAVFANLDHKERHEFARDVVEEWACSWSRDRSFSTCASYWRQRSLRSEDVIRHANDSDRAGAPLCDPSRSWLRFITNTMNWSTCWPGYVRLEEGSSWGAVGDTARLTTRLLGRERELTMTITRSSQTGS